MATLRRVGDSLYGYFEESSFDSKVSANSKQKLQGLQQSNRFTQKNRKIVLNAMFPYAKMPLKTYHLILWKTVCMCACRPLFLQTGLKKCEKEPYSSKDIWGLTNGSEKRLEQHFGGFYLMNKRAPAGRKGFIQSVLWRIKGLKGFLYSAAKHFDLILKVQNQNKKFKTCSGW